MGKFKEYISGQWAEFIAAWTPYYDDIRLSLASRLADYKYLAKNKQEQFFVLPDQDDKLLVLSPQDIERLKNIGEIKFRAVTRRKAVYRKSKSGVKRLKKIKVRIIGRKAFGISMMNHSVTLEDVSRECFYCTPLNGGRGLSGDQKEKKRDEWGVYVAEMRRRKVKKQKK